MFFQTSKSSNPLGPILKSARDRRGLSVEAAALATRLSVEKLEALENDHPIDPRWARLHAVNYARYLGLDPSTLGESLPVLPELVPKHQQYLKNSYRRPQKQRRSAWEALAPMGKISLYLLVITAILSSWGMVRQLSRVRSVPWVSSTYTIHELPTR